MIPQEDRGNSYRTTIVDIMKILKIIIMVISQIIIILLLLLFFNYYNKDYDTDCYHNH